MVAIIRRIRREKKLTRAIAYGSKPPLSGGTTMGGRPGSMVVVVCGLEVEDIVVCPPSSDEAVAVGTVPVPVSCVV